MNQYGRWEQVTVGASSASPSQKEENSLQIYVSFMGLVHEQQHLRGTAPTQCHVVRLKGFPAWQKSEERSLGEIKYFSFYWSLMGCREGKRRGNVLRIQSEASRGA